MNSKKKIQAKNAQKEKLSGSESEKDVANTVDTVDATQDDKDDSAAKEIDEFGESSFFGSLVQSIAESTLTTGVLSDRNHPIGYLVVSVQEFVDDSIRLVRRCNKPNGKEFFAIMRACGVGLAIMGFIGYFVKLIFIPINNIIIGGG